MPTNPQNDTPKKINDSDLLSSIISKSEFWHIPPSLAKFMQRRLFREFLGYFKMKEKEDKKGDKALGNEQGQLRLFGQQEKFGQSQFFKEVCVCVCISYSAERSFSGLRRLKTYLSSTIGQQRVSNIALINIKREYANSIVNNDVDRTIDIFGRRNGRDSYLF